MQSSLCEPADWPNENVVNQKMKVLRTFWLPSRPSRGRPIWLHTSSYKLYPLTYVFRSSVLSLTSANFCPEIVRTVAAKVCTPTLCPTFSDSPLLLRGTVEEGSLISPDFVVLCFINSDLNSPFSAILTSQQSARNTRRCGYRPRWRDRQRLFNCLLACNFNRVNDAV